MIYLTKYEGLESDTSSELQFDSLDAARAMMFPDVEPFQVRTFWQLFNVGGGKRVALSTFRIR